MAEPVACSFLVHAPRGGTSRQLDGALATTAVGPLSALLSSRPSWVSIVMASMLVPRVAIVDSTGALHDYGLCPPLG